MKQLNKFHREILLSNLKEAQEKKSQLKNFDFKLIKDMNDANSEKEQEAIQASMDTNMLEIEFKQNEIERIEQILIENHI